MALFVTAMALLVGVWAGMTALHKWPSGKKTTESTRAGVIGCLIDDAQAVDRVKGKAETGTLGQLINQHDAARPSSFVDALFADF